MLEPHGFAVAAPKSVTAVLASKKDQAEGDFGAEVAKSFAASQAAADALWTVQKVKSDAPQGRAQDKEAFVLRYKEEMGAQLVQAVDDARITAAEARLMRLRT